MADTRDPDVTTKNLKELYKLAIEHVRYQHGDIWRGQQFYTTLNVGILSAALALVRFFESSTANTPPTFYYGPIVLFGVGVIISVIGYYTVKRLRKYFLEAVSRKTLLEYLLGYRKKITTSRIQGFPENSGHSLAVMPVYESMKKERIKGKYLEWEENVYNEVLKDDEEILTSPDKWVKKNMGRGGVAKWLMNLQLMFAFADTLLAVLVAYRII